MDKVKKLSDFIENANNRWQQYFYTQNAFGDNIYFKIIRNIMRKSHYILIISMLVVSCSTPLSKEGYLEKFETFVSEVAEKHDTYSDKEWAKKTEKYEKFSGEWYEKFKNDFTWQEKLKITGFQTKFHYYKVLNQSSSAIKELLTALNFKEIKEKVQYYVKNDMEDDLNLLYEEARKAGGAAEKAVMEILKELQVNIEELQK